MVKAAHWVGIGLALGVALLTGYNVDRVRTVDLRELLLEADRMAVQPDPDDPGPYFTLHNDLAAAAGVQSCSTFAVRMTQRFLPEGWSFAEADVTALSRGIELRSIAVETGVGPPFQWQC